MSRILVTGITSPLGQAVGRKLQAEGHRVVGTLRSSRISSAGLPADELIALDLENKYSFTNINGGFDAFVHVAAASEGTAEELMTITGLGTLHLVERAKFLSVGRIIHISGMDAFGNISVPIVSEQTSPRYQNPYGVAKWVAESFVAGAEKSIDGISIRCPAIAGPKHRRHFLARTLTQMRERQSRIVVSNPDFLFNNIVHEDVVADFIHKLLTLPVLPRMQSLTIGSKDPIPFRTIIEYLSTISNFGGKLEWIQSANPPFSIDFSTAAKFGYTPLSVKSTIESWVRDVSVKKSTERISNNF
jgi:nucleoside-diphosphate-sugar epimerase